MTPPDLSRRLSLLYLYLFRWFAVRRSTQSRSRVCLLCCLRLVNYNYIIFRLCGYKAARPSISLSRYVFPYAFAAATVAAAVAAAAVDDDSLLASERANE